MALRSRCRRSSQYLCLFVVVVAVFLSGRATIGAAESGITQQDAGVSCKAILNAGFSSGDGLYWIDPNGGDHADAFQAYCDMTTDGGGWTLAVNSVAGEEPSTTDLTSNTGVIDFNRAHTRDLTNLAINNDAEIRYLIDDPINARLFHAKYTGRYHNELPFSFASWRTLTGHSAGSEELLSSHFGWGWYTALTERDAIGGECTRSYLVPWYYTGFACWAAIPTNVTDGLTQGPVANGGSLPLARFSIFVRETGTIAVPARSHAPSFRAAVNLPTGRRPIDVVIADFDGDGKADLLSANAEGTSTVRYGSGVVSGLFGSPTTAIATGSFNGDGLADVVVAAGTSILTFVSNGPGFSWADSFTGCSNVSSILAADFDGNGTTDLVFNCPDANALSIFSGNGDGSFGPVRTVATVLAPTLVMGDFNRDSRPDIVALGGATGCLNTFINRGGFNFTTTGQCVGAALISGAAGQVNGVRPGLVVATPNGLLMMPNIDGSHFGALLYPGPAVQDVALGDIDNDGLLDIATTRSGAQVQVWRSTGAGWTIGYFNISSTGRGLAVGDVDGDGWRDIVTADRLTDSLSFLYNDYHGNVAPEAYAGTLTVIEGTTESGTLRATDPNGDAVTFSLLSNGTKGTATLIDPSTGAFTYSANPGQSGTDTFTFTASDGVTTSDVATITVTIAAKQKPPLTWPTPAPIVYGTALGGAQLNATAGVIPGTFTYSPAWGTILGAGATQTLTVTFTPADSARYTPASASITIDVLPAPLTIKASDLSIPFGFPILGLTATFHGFVNGDSAASLAGVLTFTDPSSMNAGVYPITPGGVSSANYAISFQPGMLTIVPAATRAVIAAPASIGFLQAIPVTVSIVAVPPVFGVPSGTVQFFDGATPIGTATLGDGSAMLTVNGLLPGVHALTASYAGDGNFTPSTQMAPVSVTVRPFAESTFTVALATNNPTALGQRATFNAAVVSFGGAVPTGTVAFIDAGLIIGTATLSGGVATFSTTWLQAGPHFIVALYVGNASFAASKSTPAAHHVYSATPPQIAAMALAGPASPTTFGQAATFTVTLAPTNGMPANHVVFLVNHTLLGSAPVAAVGGTLQASVTTNTMPRGMNVISALYFGDGVFGAATTGPIVHVVQ